MRVTMDAGIKRWTAERRAALVVEIIERKTTMADASRALDLSPSDIEGRVETGRPSGASSAQAAGVQNARTGRTGASGNDSGSGRVGFDQAGEGLPDMS